VSSTYSVLSLITSDGDLQKVAATAGVMAASLILGSVAASKISTPEGIQANIVPSKVSLTSIFDFFFEKFILFHDSITGKRNRKYASLSATVFLVILFTNLLGLVPGFVAGTTTVMITVALALTTFITFNFYGIREQGFFNYIKHFAGPKWWLAPLLFPIEIFSTSLRVLTLNLRLYWNMTADHIVLGIFTDLTKYVVPVIFYALGSFVCFMQAFVFTVLTMVYIFLAVDHGEEEHH
jgi:F-type H+-transporting ATPase subunit a